MKPGDPVIHAPTGRRMTVKSVNGGNAMALCSWMEKGKAGEPEECAAAFPWHELRSPTVMAALESVPLKDLNPEKTQDEQAIGKALGQELPSPAEAPEEAHEQEPSGPDGRRPTRKAKR